MPNSRVLLVEDEATGRDLLARGLARLGFEVSTAADGAEAIVPPAEERHALAPGEYELRLLHDESYIVLASTRFTIEP